MDYTPQTRQLSLDTVGNPELCITIPVGTDDSLEGKENFFVSGTVTNFTINGTSFPSPAISNSSIMIEILDKSGMYKCVYVSMHVCVCVCVHLNSYSIMRKGA